MQINRLAITLYNLLVILAFLLKLLMVGPVLYGHVWLFWLLLSIFSISILFLSNRAFFHPTPLEIVSYHINLIMRYSTESQDEAYDVQNKRYLAEDFIGSKNFEFFYYDKCCAKINEYNHMNIKLTMGKEAFNEVIMIIKTMDERYIKFRLIKPTEYSGVAFLYDWMIDQIEYSDPFEFSELLRERY